MAAKIRVLVVDDSAFVRKVVTQMLSRSPEIDVVGAARDGREALELVERHSPDVITLDLVMPRMNGVEFIREQNTRRRIPTVICSIANESGEMALEALELGAIDFVQKPTALATDRIFEMADELVAKVKTAASVPMQKIPVPAAAATPVRLVASTPRASSVGIVVIGVSTGGPQALRQIIPLLGADFPVPVAIVLHMPIGYTAMYAQRLNELSPLAVVEAREGDEARPGTVLLAPAGRHMTFRRAVAGEAPRVHLDVRPTDTPYKPSVDELFRSAAEVYDGGVLGVIMTGMGNDGTAGARHIKSAGGRILTEAEFTCVVYGMPRSVVEAGLSDRSAPLPELPEMIVEMLG
jgi:two-component system chemotaxis response regulator CheB